MGQLVIKIGMPMMMFNVIATRRDQLPMCSSRNILWLYAGLNPELAALNGLAEVGSVGYPLLLRPHCCRLS
ncbi:hypothetical protein [Neisseria iguanae]|uniref:Uncharacterized protein n=1 Tax=Neisseria iguanae TaxID=90242 RepID=A0A2P7U3F5_9NEIS|nr:hypothetical protein [Neisseria iguanae]PSJ81508.1 hypothetical protein C7N83_00325 [Neisseria iguanae]